MIFSPYHLAKWHTPQLATRYWVCQLGKMTDIDSLACYGVPNGNI